MAYSIDCEDQTREKQNIDLPRKEGEAPGDYPLRVKVRKSAFLEAAVLNPPRG
jgi:hypothetical protein